ncbi:amidohydrolase [Patescibacteria group bacterium]|nr:amidohydrolase [Candidatus Falkowbacteria bacterium]MBU3906450.1 amidohydrolase [Patescibacteria group bacterium]MBU4014740.1 amidohydrolase [Patescibacteria group bacterium]MBU4027086.1 amidohydrolase [Patescibacteria group bacterium]MBU4073629.1 amidohydrolase [Patescibacteria group bacterium]
MRETISNQPSSQVEKQKNKTESLDFILEKSKELGPEMIENYREIHENPELGGEEFETARKVKDYLQNLSIEIVGEGIGGSGIIARIKGKEGGPTIALRADMDALPVQEAESNSPRSQKDGVMHACGHDSHTAALMGAAKMLKELADKGELNGSSILLFQPSEEKAHQKESGAVQMIKFLEKSGLRKNIDAFLGLHVFNSLERGQVQLKEGVQLASSGEVDVILKGPGGHIINAYDTPSLHHIFSKLTLRLEEMFKPMEKKEEALVASARTKYAGTGYNILPAEAESTWVVRVTSPHFKEISKSIEADIKRIANEVVAEHLKEIKEETGRTDIGNVDILIKKRPGYRPVVHRSPELVGIADKSAEQVIDNYQKNEKLLMGGEDFSFYLENFQGKEIPGVFAMIGSANPEKGYPKTAHHTPDFKIDPDAIKDLAALYSNFTVNAIEYFKEKRDN